MFWLVWKQVSISSVCHQLETHQLLVERLLEGTEEHDSLQLLVAIQLKIQTVFSRNTRYMLYAQWY
jgi:hypothetical protein